MIGVYGKMKQNERFSSFEINGQEYYVTVANNIQLREKSYRLLYDIYINSGLGLTNESKMWYSLTELLPSAITILIMREEEAVASISFVSDSCIGIPVDDCFKEEVNSLRLKGNSVAEIFSLGVKEGERNSRILLGKLFNFTSVINHYILGNSHFVITVVPRHAAFYCNKLLFEEYKKVGFHKKTGVECKLLVSDISDYMTLSEDVIKKTFYKYYLSEREVLNIIDDIRKEIIPISKNEFEYFLNIKPELCNDLTIEQKIYLERTLKGNKKL